MGAPERKILGDKCAELVEELRSLTDQILEDCKSNLEHIEITTGLHSTRRYMENQISEIEIMYDTLFSLDYDNIT